MQHQSCDIPQWMAGKEEVHSRSLARRDAQESEVFMTRRNILITGRPGIGKTTIITKMAEALEDLDPVGFITREIREGGARKGFTFVSLCGEEGVLAHVDTRSPFRVGRYKVDRDGFERMLASLDLLASPSRLVLIDEIGKMECFSPKFIRTVEALLDSDKILVATIAAKGAGFIGSVRARPDADLLEVTVVNRDSLPRDLVSRIRTLL